MIAITIVEADGTERLIFAEASGDLMNAARTADIGGILAECGGGCSCGTCHVFVDSDWLCRLPPPADDEADMLSLSDNLSDGSRLACQIRLTESLDGLRVYLPETQG
jgi:2Fe-2S ferredoxin